MLYIELGFPGKSRVDREWRRAYTSIVAMQDESHTTPLKTPRATSFRVRETLLICVLLIAATLAVYWRAGGFEFVPHDDGSYVYQNHHIQKGLDLETVKWSFATFYCHNWHPLTWLSHALDWRLYGQNAGGHHITNLLLHMANCLLLFAALSRMTGSVRRSGFVAALFALHPLHVESVAWVAERKDVLSALFWMLTLLAYKSYSDKRGRARYALVMGTFALGLMSKPMLVSLPIVLLLLDTWPLRRTNALAEKAPLFALAAASCVVTYAAQLYSGAAQTLENYPVGVRVANALVSCVAYAWKMIWPRGLSPFYPHPEDTLPVWQVAGSAALLAGVTYAAIRLRPRAPYVFVGWLWYLVTLAPVIGLVQVGEQAMADRYTYIPLVGLFIIIAWGVPDLLRVRFRKAILAGGAAVVLACLMVGAWSQVGCWRNMDALMQRVYDCAPENYGVRCWIASYLDKQGKWDVAYALLSRSLENRAGLAGVHNGLGCLLSEKGRVEEAAVHFRKALKLKPNLVTAHNNLGTIYMNWGHVEDALRQYREAARIDPYKAEPHFNIASALASLGQTEEALSEYDRAAQLDPQRVDAICKAGIMLLQLGRNDDAIARFRAAAETAPESPGPPFLLGNALCRRGQTDEAIEQLRKAVALKKDWGPAHYSLAVALSAKGDYAEALREARIAQRCGYAPDPKFLKTLTEESTRPGR